MKKKKAETLGLLNNSKHASPKSYSRVSENDYIKIHFLISIQIFAHSFFVVVVSQNSEMN